MAFENGVPSQVSKYGKPDNIREFNLLSFAKLGNNFSAEVIAEDTGGKIVLNTKGDWLRVYKDGISSSCRDWSIVSDESGDGYRMLTISMIVHRGTHRMNGLYFDMNDKKLYEIIYK